MAVPSRRVATGAALLACSVIQAGCSSVVSDPAPFANGRYQQPTRFDDIYRNRAPDVVRYDRYTLVSTRPDDAQRDPLNQIVDITMPAQLVKTVGEGFRYLLLESGYSLCSATTSAFSELLSRPLPAVQRDIGPVRLSEALQIVAGPAWRLKVDDVNREICFELRDQYRSFAAPLPAPVSLASQHAPVSLPPVIQPARTGGAASTVNTVPRNPFTGDTRINSTPGTVQKPVLTPQNQSVPSPVLTVAKTPAKAPAAQKSAALAGLHWAPQHSVLSVRLRGRASPDIPPVKRGGQMVHPGCANGCWPALVTTPERRCNDPFRVLSGKRWPCDGWSAPAMPASPETERRMLWEVLIT